MVLSVGGAQTLPARGSIFGGQGQCTSKQPLSWLFVRCLLCLRPTHTCITCIMHVSPRAGKSPPSCGLASHPPSTPPHPPGGVLFLCTCCVHGQLLSSFTLVCVRVAKEDVVREDDSSMLVGTNPVTWSSTDGSTATPTRHFGAGTSMAGTLRALLTPPFNPRWGAARLLASSVKKGLLVLRCLCSYTFTQFVGCVAAQRSQTPTWIWPRQHPAPSQTFASAACRTRILVALGSK